MNPRQLARLCSLEAIAAAENLMLAAANARWGKRSRPGVEDWWLRRERNVLRLSEALRSGDWQPGGYPCCRGGTTLRPPVHGLNKRSCKTILKSPSSCGELLT